MSIAWATVVLVVLLLPGFCFFWGFYLPHQVTRESVPANPLAQLAGVVIYGFFFHGIAYWLVNRVLDGGHCEPAAVLLPCLDFDLFASIVRLDGTPPVGKTLPALNQHFATYSGWILLYFAVAAGLSMLIGWGAGALVANGTLPMNRHRYLFTLEQARKAANEEDAALLVRAHVLSKTTHGDLVVLYDGLVRDFFARADGTINYLVLRGPRSTTLKIEAGKSRPSGDPQPLASGQGDSSQAFLLIASDDIANVYFEPITVVQTKDSQEELDAALKRMDDSAAEEASS
ncbi:MAG TPA: hypothetical protein VJN68_01480 [Burkholderiaceae bacterium]|nr:hypothetical protein [Burkholderiaceae bacterium]